MKYMKVYSTEEAHPIDRDGVLINVETAKTLVDEPINTRSIRRHYVKYEWDDTLRNLVKGYIDVLATLYCTDNLMNSYYTIRDLTLEHSMKQYF